jgi:hypothetical protein
MSDTERAYLGRELINTLVEGLPESAWEPWAGGTSESCQFGSH